MTALARLRRAGVVRDPRHPGLPVAIGTAANRAVLCLLVIEGCRVALLAELPRGVREDEGHSRFVAQGAVGPSIHASLVSRDMARRAPQCAHVVAVGAFDLLVTVDVGRTTAEASKSPRGKRPS